MFTNTVRIDLFKLCTMATMVYKNDLLTLGYVMLCLYPLPCFDDRFWIHNGCVVLLLYISSIAVVSTMPVTGWSITLMLCVPWAALQGQGVIPASPIPMIA